MDIWHLLLVLCNNNNKSIIMILNHYRDNDNSHGTYQLAFLITFFGIWEVGRKTYLIQALLLTLNYIFQWVRGGQEAIPYATLG